MAGVCDRGGDGLRENTVTRSSRPIHGKSAPLQIYILLGTYDNKKPQAFA